MIHFIKQDGKFKPVYKTDIDTWNKIPENKIYAMRYKRDRNAKHHRKLFAIANLIIQNSPEDSMWNNKTAYLLIKSTEMELGYVEEVLHMNGEITFEPQSINFESWGQDEFERFYEDAITYWCSHFGYERDVLENNYEEYL